MPTSDDYILLEDIGRGSFGTIRKVKRKSDGAIMARKEISYARMNAKEKEQLTSEFGILSTVKHPHIVEYYHREHIKAERMLYIYMEYCGNGDLGGLIRRCQEQKSALREEVIWSIFGQLVCALYRCHYGVDPPPVDDPPPNTPGQVPPPQIRGKTVIHRDLKPENVFLDEDNFVKLGDFGLSKVLGPEQKLAMTFVGTPLYMSPELVSDTGYTHKTDIWSLGCIIYELCNLTTPFTARAQHILIQRIQEGRYSPIPSHYSPELRKVIDWCLRAEPDSRPETAQLLHTPMVKIARKERDVVLYRNRVAAREEMCKMREAQISVNEREVLAKSRELITKELELANKEKEMKQYLEEASRRLREQLNMELRAEWKEKAETEIKHQYQRTRDELNTQFEYEVSRRVEVIVATRLEEELERRIRQMNLVPASSLSSTNSSTSSQLSGTTCATSISTFSTPPRQSCIPATDPESPADIDMSSPSHWITPALHKKERARLYEEAPPKLDLTQDLLEQQRSLNEDHPTDKLLRPTLLHQHSEPIQHVTTDMDELFDEPDHMNQTQKQNTLFHARMASLESPIKRAPGGGLSRRTHTTTGVNLFPEVSRQEIVPLSRSDDFAALKISTTLKLAAQLDEKRNAEAAQRRALLDHSPTAATWDPNSIEAPSPYKKDTVYVQ